MLSRNSEAATKCSLRGTARLAGHIPKTVRSPAEHGSRSYSYKCLTTSSLFAALTKLRSDLFGGAIASLDDVVILVAIRAAFSWLPWNVVN